MGQGRGPTSGNVLSVTVCNAVAVGVLRWDASKLEWLARHHHHHFWVMEGYSIIVGHLVLRKGEWDRRVLARKHKVMAVHRRERRAHVVGHSISISGLRLFRNGSSSRRRRRRCGGAFGRPLRQRSRGSRGSRRGRLVVLTGMLLAFHVCGHVRRE